MHLSHDTWEVIDQKHVPQVPAYFDDSLVHIKSISADDVSHTYTFDASCPLSSSPRSPFKLLKSPKSPKLTRSPSPSFSDDSDESVPFGIRDPHDFTPAQARDALISARSQFLSSSDLRKMGANVLFTEGWSITKLKKGSRYRLQVQYTARPAKAMVAAKDAYLGLPPFMDLLEGSW